MFEGDGHVIYADGIADWKPDSACLISYRTTRRVVGYGWEGEMFALRTWSATIRRSTQKSRFPMSQTYTIPFNLFEYCQCTLGSRWRRGCTGAGGEPLCQLHKLLLLQNNIRYRIRQYLLSKEYVYSQGKAWHTTGAVLRAKFFLVSELVTAPQNLQELIRRWDSKRQLFTTIWHVRTSKY